MRLEARSIATPSLDGIKMEDRKRPIADDAAPPPKRQAVAVNGTRSHPDADMPWKDDLEAFTKDAIYRQMREFKREKTTLESQLSEVEKRAAYHDDHIRTLDKWFDQLIDEIKIRTPGQLPASEQSKTNNSLPSSIFFEDNESLKKHLASRRETILSTLEGLFARYSPSGPDATELQTRLSALLATEKDQLIELQRANSEKEQLSDRLDTATRRYLIAEKKIDRLKSSQVQKLEQQAVASGFVVKEEPQPSRNGADSVKRGSPSPVNEELELARNEAVAEATKRKAQLDEAEQENKKLTEDVSALRIKLGGLSEDDFAKTDLFKAMKAAHEDVIKRVNHSEADNTQLREELQKLQAERTAYRIKIDEEVRTQLAESESSVVQAEANLSRIRAARDELVAKINVIETGQKQSRESVEQATEMLSACEQRMTASESECERLRLEIAELKQHPSETEGDSTGGTVSGESSANISSLENRLKLMTNELPSIEAAWKKAYSAAQKKLKEIQTWEENIAKANADKAKADQKFFAAMKAKGELEQQLRILRLQSSKSTEVVAQLKEADSLNRSLADKLEKQCAEMRTHIEELSAQQRQLQQKVNENATTSETLLKEKAELKKVIESRDNIVLVAKHAQREAEVENEKYKVRAAALEKQVQTLKRSAAGGEDSETQTQTQLMRNMLQCLICKSNFKNTVIKTCGHMFCDQCVQDRLTNRARKCPSCGKAFGSNDTMRVHL